MNRMKEGRRSAAASQAENPTIAEYSSPPCLLHELDSTYLGYLGRQEILDLLADLLAVDLPGTRLEKAWVRAMLFRHIARVDQLRAREAAALHRWPDAGNTGAVSAPDHERWETRLTDALPRLEDQALRQDLGQVLAMLRRDRQGEGLLRYG
jgi:hypothetical protein